MTRRLSPENQLELEAVYRVARVFAEFLDGLTPGLSPSAIDTVDRVHAACDLRGLRQVRNDFVAMADAATLEQRRLLDAALKERANTSLNALSTKTLKRIEQIRARGRITSEEQYFLVRERVVFLESDSSNEVEAAELAGLLNAYEARSHT